MEDILIWLEELADDVKSMHKHRDMDDLHAYFSTTNALISDDRDKCAVPLNEKSFRKIVDVLNLTVFMRDYDGNYYLYFDLFDVNFYTLYKNEVKNGN